MNIESIQQNSKTIFISLIAFSVVVLIVVSYFVFVGNDNKSVNNNNNNNNNNNIISTPIRNEKVSTPPSVSKII